MNPLGNGNIGSLPVGLKQNIQQVKMMMNNPTAILQQNPMFSQLMQTYKGQDLKSIFYNLAQQKEVSKMHIELIDKIIRDGSDEDMECLRKILIELISDLKYTDYDKYKKNRT